MKLAMDAGRISKTQARKIQEIHERGPDGEFEHPIFIELKSEFGMSNKFWHDMSLLYESPIFDTTAEAVAGVRDYVKQEVK